MTAGTNHTPSPVVVDASVWVAFFIAGDVHHTASEAWIDKHTQLRGLIVAPAMLLAEVAAAISRRLGRPDVALQAASTLNSLSSLQILDMDATLIDEVTNIAASYKLRAGDAVYVAIARQLGLPLLTWDKEQLSRPATVITARTP
jgi:predicted nucleic acid-binding protein